MSNKFALALGLSLLAGGALAQEYKVGLSGPAAIEIGRYIENTQIGCYKPAGETKCRIGETASQTSVYYGSFLNSSLQHALAFVTYQYDVTGNAVDQMAVLFKETDGQWKPAGRALNTIGTDPRELAWGKDTIAYTGTVVGQNDSRANPNGSGRFRLQLTNKGLTFIKPAR
jgi:hypothetical protein